MTAAPAARTIGLMLSGGLDSCILLGRLLADGYRVQPFFIRAGLLWEEDELRAVRRYCQALSSVSSSSVSSSSASSSSAFLSAAAPLVVMSLPVGDLYGQHWSTTGHDVPDADSPDEAVFLPGRNALLTIKPLLWCAAHDIEELAIGVLRSNPFSDATAAFLDQYAAALALAAGRPLRIVRPFAGMDKRQVMGLGRHLPL
ncbi:MAG: 7-cyano-7-deazaguanine synthase, partial [Patescibacteria group bacterium]|nr:7-cyano-7-deazaguanine synthase [Patescibacteria group bacterium]